MMVTPASVAWPREEVRMPGRTARAARQPQVSSAPGELEKVRAFVNTRDIEEGTDDLATPAGLADWLTRSGLVPAPGHLTRATPADLERAVALRESLRGILRSHVRAAAEGQAGSQRTETGGDLRRIAAALPVRLQVSDDGRVRPVPAGSGAAAALASLLLIAAESAALGTWPRLKACGADDCQWAFYDRSPTRNGCWCSMRVCGARAKSRAYRQRAGSSPRRGAGGAALERLPPLAH
jgi:predicted RNA-binding Zn ribbon-like protein